MKEKPKTNFHVTESWGLSQKLVFSVRPNIIKSCTTSESISTAEIIDDLWQKSIYLIYAIKTWWLSPYLEFFFLIYSKYFFIQKIKNETFSNLSKLWFICSQ